MKQESLPKENKSVNPTAVVLTLGSVATGGSAVAYKDPNSLLTIIDAEITPSTLTNLGELITDLPQAYTDFYVNIGMSNGQSCSCIVQGTKLKIYYPSSGLQISRMDINITYFRKYL